MSARLRLMSSRARHHPIRRAVTEALERRVMLAAVPVGAEFQVNTFTPDRQWSPSIATNATGDFVVTWQSMLLDGSGDGIFAQRYNAAGVPQGGEFQVNTYTTGDQLLPSVAMDADGDFVIAWASIEQDGSDYGIFAQRYNAAGAAQGDEFQVNTYTVGKQSRPSVAMDADGQFVIAWQSRFQDGSDYGVYAQRYDAAGNPLGAEFQVNTYTTSAQIHPKIAMSAEGSFVITWQSFGQDGSDWGVYARRYDMSGAPQDTEFRVNTYTMDFQALPRIAMNDEGAFVIAWGSSGQDGSIGSIFAQRYDAAGAPVGEEFRVNTYTTGSQWAPSVAIDADGDFVIAWDSRDQIGIGYDVFAQRFSAAAVPLADEFLVNTYTTNDQLNPSVAMDSKGDFVVVWESFSRMGRATAFLPNATRSCP